MTMWQRLKYRQQQNRKQQSRNQTQTETKVPDQVLEEHDKEKINGNVEDTIAFVQNLLGESEDIIMRRFHVFGHYPAVMFYCMNMVDQAIINRDILRSFMYLPPHLEGKKVEPSQLKDVLWNESLYYSKGEFDGHLSALVEAILRGDTVVVVDGLDEAFLISTRQVEHRAIDQPGTEQVIRGAREGFIESIVTNITLLRYRLPTPNFRVNTMHIGRLTKSMVAICYIEGIVNPTLVEEVKKRLSAIDIDGVLDAGYLEQFIEDNHLSPFPQVQSTERPDKSVATMLEGRVVILVDGSPFALIVPSVFTQFYQTMDDYSERFLMGSLIRLVRLAALIFSLFFPALYVAVISFNPELIPTEFAVAVAGGRAGVPFPAVVEVLFMEISMEVLREATLRLPQQVGGALSIVGVLVVGQAAVGAGFASPITVVVVALTTIGSFATPAYNAAIALRMLRFPIVILAGTFGLYGIMVGFILINNHSLSLKSFGVPYLSPLVPGNWQGMKDSLMRAPLWWMTRRPAQLHTPNQDRLGSIDEFKEPASNTLDPLKVGNKRWGTSNGVSSRDHGDPGSGDSD